MHVRHSRFHRAAAFTKPELAQVGLTEEQAGERSRQVAVHRLALEHVDGARASGSTDGFIKIVASLRATPWGEVRRP
ncbi:MAG TPA: hypothetical protein VKK19_07180 [Candidatus Dormibacteraeota bacterium]|nr:hypothetical protein [Candidatus Dormibacteraeota bacterium]